MQQEKKRGKRWVGSWAAAQQLVEEHNIPPEPEFYLQKEFFYK